MTDQTVYLIRKIHDKKVYYLKEYDITLNEAQWTQKFMAAHHFLENEKAKYFIKLHLPTRDCDVYEHEAMWVI